MKSLLVLLVALVTITSSDQCPQQCECSKNLKVVNCERKKLTDIPQGIPQNVTELYLGFNYLTTIPPKIFQNYTKLNSLSLKNNVIVNIAPYAFDGLKSLKYLFLTSNKLKGLSKDVFYGLTSIQNLYLSQNILEGVPDVGHCSSLIKLGLDNNIINNVSIPLSFSSLYSFKSIAFNNNPITSIDVENLKPLRDLPISKFNFGVCKLANIETGTFSGFKYLQSLVLSYNEHLPLSSLQNVLESLNESAILNSIDLSSSLQTASYLPPDIFSRLSKVPLKKLLLRHNSLSVIKSGTFQYLPKVDLLDLSDGKLVNTEDGAFQGMTGLKTLTLYNNNLIHVPRKLPKGLIYLDLKGNRQIENIQEYVFLNNSFLNNLTLSNCGLLRLNNFAFKGLVRLKHLDLSKNRLSSTSIGNQVFKDLPNLLWLDLSYNSITEIATDVSLFQPAMSLQHLDMSHNNLRRFPCELFHSMNELNTLILDGNNLNRMINSDINGRIFRYLTNIETLSTQECQIDVMPDHLFSNLTSLNTLNLQGNIIEFLNGKLFENTSVIQSVNLSKNRIKSIHQDSFLFLRSRGKNVTVDFQNNPFDCYCDMVWFRKWYEKANVALPGNESYKCAYPGNEQGLNFKEFDPSKIYYQCFPPLYWYMLAGGIIVIIMCMIISPIVYKNRWKIRLYMYRKRHHITTVQRRPEAYEYLSTFLCSDEQFLWVREISNDIANRLEISDNLDLLFRNIEDGDFGHNIIQIMAENIERCLNSYQVILVVSEDYINDSKKCAELDDFLANILATTDVSLTNRVTIIIFVENDNEIRITDKFERKYNMLTNHEELIVVDDNDNDSRIFCLDRLSIELRIGMEYLVRAPLENAEENDDPHRNLIQPINT